MNQRTIGRPLDARLLDRIVGGTGDLAATDFEPGKFGVTPEMIDALGEFDGRDLMRAYAEGMENPSSEAFGSLLAKAGFPDGQGLAESLVRDFALPTAPEGFMGSLIGVLKGSFAPSAGETVDGAPDARDPAVFEPEAGLIGDGWTGDDWGTAPKSEEPSPTLPGPVPDGGMTEPEEQRPETWDTAPDDTQPDSSVPAPAPMTGTVLGRDGSDPGDFAFDASREGDQEAWERVGGWLVDNDTAIYRDPDLGPDFDPQVDHYVKVSAGDRDGTEIHLMLSQDTYDGILKDAGGAAEKDMGKAMSDFVDSVGGGNDEQMNNVSTRDGSELGDFAFDSQFEGDRAMWERGGGWLVDGDKATYRDPDLGSDFDPENDPHVEVSAEGEDGTEVTLVLSQDSYDAVMGDAVAATEKEMGKDADDLTNSIGTGAGMVLDEAGDIGAGGLPQGTVRLLAGSDPTIRVMDGAGGATEVTEAERQRFFDFVGGGLVTTTDASLGIGAPSIGFATPVGHNPAEVNVAPELAGESTVVGSPLEDPAAPKVS
ncbi:MAG: hypothetical protein PHS60_10010 [Zavarzinia sp.]|nr:hypothetical protein [Zavarzinia sp.]